MSGDTLYIQLGDTYEGIGISSDWHKKYNEPLTRIEQAFFRTCKEQKLRPVLDGDILDAVIYGWQSYKPSVCLQSFLSHVPPLGCHLILGNHDPTIKQARKIFADTSVTVHQSKLTIVLTDSMGRKQVWDIMHGDQFAIDWKYLRPVYLWVADQGKKTFPKQWLWFCRRMGWATSHRLSKMRRSWITTGIRVEREKFNHLTGIVWGNALKYATDKDRCVCIGHTHLANEDHLIGLDLKVLDDGDLKDETWAKITKDEAKVLNSF